MAGWKKAILCFRNGKNPVYWCWKGKRSVSTSQRGPQRLSYFHQPGSEPLQHLTIGQLVDRAAQRLGDSECLVEVETGKRKTFSEIKQEADKLASGFIAMGFQHGDRVGVWGPNSYEWYLTFLAAAKAGLILVTVNPALQAREVTYCVNKVQMKGLIIARKFQNQNYYKILAAAFPELENAKPGGLKSKAAPSLSTVVTMGKEPPGGTFSFDEAFNAGGSDASKRLTELDTIIQMDDPCNIQFTSGTTGNPKAATLSHHGMVNNAYFVARRLRFRFGQGHENSTVLPDGLCRAGNQRCGLTKDYAYASFCQSKHIGDASSDFQPCTVHLEAYSSFQGLGKSTWDLPILEKITLTVPLFHCYGNVCGILCCFQHGSTLVMPSTWFDPKAAVKAAESEKCTIMYGTPTMYVDMLKEVDDLKPDLSSMNGAVTGGAICPLQLIQDIRSKMNVKWAASIYGMTETSPVSLQSNDNDPIEKLNKTVGYAQDHLEVKVVDSDGKIVPVGTPGELYVRGYVTMLGYWGEPEKTRETITSSRWLRTGDQFVFDEDGYGSVVGRIKDLVIRGGENVYPSEIEDFLLQHPKIIEVYVVGVPDKRLGEELCVWIRLKDGESITSEEVRKFCKGQIASYKIPKYVHFTSDFPKTASGKIQKFKMQELSIDVFNLERP